MYLKENTRKIKIAFVIDTIDYETGGTERQLTLLLKHLDRSRFKPYLCCFKDSKWLQDNSRDIVTHVFRFDSFYSPADYFRLFRFSRFLRSQGIDIVQTHFRDGNIIGILAAKLAGINAVISTRRNQGYWHDRKEVLLLKILNRFVTGFLANSRVVKSYVHNVEGVPKDKIKVIYNGFEALAFKKRSDDEKKEARLKMGMRPGSTAVVNVSNLRPVKCIDVFLRAAKILVEERADALFLIVGDGPERNQLVKLSKELKIDNNVIFLGSRDDVPDILSVCDIGVLSSKSEGLSNSIIEYMAAGLPVVCTDVGGNGELVADSLNGFLVQPENHRELAASIKKLIDNVRLREEMSHASLKRAHSTFSFNEFINNTETYYENIINNGVHK